MLEEIFPNIAARGDIKTGVIPGRSSWIVQPNESVRSKPTVNCRRDATLQPLRVLWRIALWPGFPETEGKRGLFRCGVCEGNR